MDRIDVGKILESKAPRLKRYIPRAVINWLRGIIQEDFLNNTIGNFGDKPPMEFIRGVFGLLDIERSVEGFENIDPEGRYIFASNHPFGGMDGMMLAEAIGSR
ncbi:MAG: acyltransferase, partial [Rikenellaceae bacterium]|nr:acyltransferase [Rikenellaceae bacterium]